MIKIFKKKTKKKKQTFKQLKATAEADVAVMSAPRMK